MSGWGGEGVFAGFFLLPFVFTTVVWFLGVLVLLLGFLGVLGEFFGGLGGFRMCFCWFLVP